MSPKLDQFMQGCAQLAQRLGLQHVVIVARDESENRMAASTGAIVALRSFVAGKLNLIDAAQVEALQRHIEELTAALDGSETHWE